MKIWKFELNRTPYQKIKIPENSIILDIQIQDGKIMMWAMCASKAFKAEMNIYMHPTGGETNTSQWYLKTIQDGEFVWHFFTDVK
jgi:hypothetical protein